MDPAPFSVEPPPVGAPPPPSGWAYLRPYVAIAAALLLLLLPPAGTIAHVAIAAAFVAVLACLWPLGGRASGAAARWLLLAGGVGGVLAPLLYANPYVGIDSMEWLWVYWAGARAWMPKADILLWVVVCGLAVVAACLRGGRVVRSVVLAGTVLVAARALAERGALAMVRVDRVNLLWTLSAIAVGGGLLHLASPVASRRGTARLLAVTGSLGIVSVYAGWFPPENGGRFAAIAYYADEIPRLLAATVGSAETDPSFGQPLLEQLWAVGVPFLAQTLAVVIALGVSMFPSRVRARPLRWASALGVLALAATWVVPVRAGLWFRADELAARGVSRVTQTVAECFMKAGFAPWLCGVGALAGLLPARDERAIVGGAERGSGRGLRALYAAAAALALVVLWVGFRRDGGLVVDATVADVLAAGRWDPPSAVLAFEGSFTLAAFAAVFVPAGRSRGVVLGLVSLLVLGSLSSVMQRSVGGVEVFVAPALGAVAAGAALGAARGARSARGLAAGAALVLLALLLYPTLEPEVAVDAVPPYRTNLWDVALEPLLRADGPAELLERMGEPGRWLILGLAGTALLSCLAAATGGRWSSRLAVGTFVGVACLVPVALTVLGTAGGGAPTDPLTAVLRAGMTLRAMLVPYAIALCAAVTDLTARSGCPPETSQTAPPSPFAGTSEIARAPGGAALPPPAL